MTRDAIDRCFDRLTSSGDLAILHAIVTDARALVERELLNKLAHYPAGTPEDFVAFAYRQGWLRALLQLQALFQPDDMARRGRGLAPEHLAVEAFEDDSL